MAERFRCLHCRKQVLETENMGTSNRNHCSFCLWSKHLDEERAGDRQSICQAGMVPLGLTQRHEGYDKYSGKLKKGELMLIHQCIACGKFSINRITADDNTRALMDLFLNSQSLDTKIRQKLSKSGIQLLADEQEVKTQLFGRPKPKKQILVSVVVPAYNEEKNIKRCLAALKKQDFPAQDFEIIVVDNNSTDKTASIAQNLGVKVVPEKIQGVNYARRKGCALARGGIIAISDADSQVPKDWLKKIYSAFQHHPRAVCVGGRVILRPKRILSVVSEILFFLGARFLGLYSAINFSIKKDVYQKINGFRKEINFCEDIDLSLRAKKEGKLIYLWNNPVVSSSRHFKGLTGLVYSLKGCINIFCLVFFQKAPFYQFGVVREN